MQVDVDPRTRAATLDFATRQMVELAKALTLEEHASGHLVILLDEPTSVLERHEIEILFARVRALKARASFIFVSHRLSEVLELSDRIYVMKDGAVVAELQAAEADVKTLHRLMVGRGLQAEYYREPLQRPFGDDVVLELEGLGCGDAYRDVSFKLHAGEILGIAGVLGSGREELTRSLAGLLPHDRGRLRRRRPRGAAFDAGRRRRRRSRLCSPRAAGRGARAVPLRRRQHHAAQPQGPCARRADRPRRGAEAGEILGRAPQRVRTPGVDALCLNLSGGNQQKVVLAKWLNAKARILILDHPTRGLDVGAKEEVYELVRAVTNEGVAVILTSDTLEETIGLSHTVLVMRDGVVTYRTSANPGAKPHQVDLIGHMV